MFLRLAQSTAPQASCAPALARRTHWPPLSTGFHGKLCSWDECARRYDDWQGHDELQLIAAAAHRNGATTTHEPTALPWQFVNQQPN